VRIKHNTTSTNGPTTGIRIDTVASGEASTPAANRRHMHGNAATSALRESSGGRTTIVTIIAGTAATPVTKAIHGTISPRVSDDVSPVSIIRRVTAAVVETMYADHSASQVRTRWRRG